MTSTNVELQSGQDENRLAPAWDIRTDDMPSDMQVLLADYPRDSWTEHAGFKDKTRQWLGAHQMFRRLSKAVRTDTESYIDGSKADDEYLSLLAYRGGALVNNLHGHHGWEDHSYFPELSAADARFDKGLDILEKDHAVLNEVLHEFADSANRLIKLSQLDEGKAQNEAGKVHAASETIELLLQRHLSDEEELAVPIILHHRLRG